jgi:hypothetical protein
MSTSAYCLPHLLVDLEAPPLSPRKDDPVKQYSPFFSTQEDTAEYTRLRAVLTTPGACFYDFIIAWDEDHDERVLWLAEQLFVMGLLTEVLGLAESKGHVVFVLANGPQEQLVHTLSSLADRLPGDAWGSDAVPMNTDWALRAFPEDLHYRLRVSTGFRPLSFRKTGQEAA